MGTKTKSWESDQTNTEDVTIDTFKNFKYEKLKICNYNEYIKEMEIFYNDNEKEKIRNETLKCSLINTLCRFDMGSKGIDLVKESDIKFDYIIQTRFDVESMSLPNIQTIEKNELAVCFLNNTSMDHFKNTKYYFKNISRGLPSCLFYYFDFSNIDKVIDAISKKFVFDNFYSLEDKRDGILSHSTEGGIILLFTLKNFIFKKLPGLPRVNRHNKYINKETSDFTTYMKSIK